MVHFYLRIEKKIVLKPMVIQTSVEPAPKLVEPIPNHDFCGTQLQEFETIIRNEIKSGPSKTRSS